MQKYLEKMFTERTELERRIKKAKNAIENPPYGISKTQLLLLAEQVKAMTEYLTCLNKRIDYDTNEKK